MREAGHRCAFSCSAFSCSPRHRSSAGEHRHRSCGCRTGWCGHDTGAGLRRPFGSCALRELPFLRRDADRDRGPACLRARTAGPVRRGLEERLRPRRARLRRTGLVHGPLPFVLGPCSPVSVHITNAKGADVYPGDVALSCPAILGEPIPPHGSITAVGDLGPTVGGHAGWGRSCPRVRTPSPSTGGYGSPCSWPSGRGCPGPSPGPGPGPHLAAGSVPAPVAGAHAHPVGPHRVRGLPVRPGDPERHRPSPSRALEPAAPLHGAPRQHRPCCLRSPGGPSRRGVPRV